MRKTQILMNNPVYCDMIKHDLRVTNDVLQVASYELKA